MIFHILDCTFYCIIQKIYFFYFELYHVNVIFFFSDRLYAENSAEDTYYGE